MVPAGTWLEACLEVLHGPISEGILRGLLEYGEYRGVGQWRGGSYGRFRYALDQQ